MMEVKIPTSKIREVLESSGYAYTPDNIAAVRANIPLHTSDLILAALNATDLPDTRSPSTSVITTGRGFPIPGWSGNSTHISHTSYRRGARY